MFYEVDECQLDDYQSGLDEKVDESLLEEGRAVDVFLSFMDGNWVSLSGMDEDG